MSVLPVLQSDVSPESPLPWQAQFLTVLPAVQAHAALRFRYLPAEARAEATQEAIASACVAFQRLAAGGKLHSATATTLAGYAVKHVHSGRHVGGSRDAARDALSPSTRHQGLRIVSYDCLESPEGTWEEVVVEDKRSGVADLAAFRLDFQQWLKEMDERDRKIIAALAAGEGTGEVAGRWGLTAGRVSQLRREYERLWRVFQGEVPAAARAN